MSTLGEDDKQPQFCPSAVNITIVPDLLSVDEDEESLSVTILRTDSFEIDPMLSLSAQVSTVGGIAQGKSTFHSDVDIDVFVVGGFHKIVRPSLILSQWLGINFLNHFVWSVVHYSAMHSLPKIT